MMKEEKWEPERRRTGESEVEAETLFRLDINVWLLVILIFKSWS